MGYPLYPVVEIHYTYTAVIGVLAGVVLYIGDRLRWIHKPGLTYVATFIMGMFLAGLCTGLTYLIIRLNDVVVHVRVTAMQMVFQFILVGFMTVFGFTFPERWFRMRGIERKE